MLDYIFFNRKTCHLFEISAKSADIKTLVDCADDCFTVRLPEDLDEVILEKLEDYYDELVDIDRTLSEQQSGPS
jgi:hypothetical protein